MQRVCGTYDPEKEGYVHAHGGDSMHGAQACDTAVLHVIVVVPKMSTFTSSPYTAN